MTNLRENLGWIMGSAVAGIVAFLSWFFESGLLSTLVGIVIGAGITYFVQTRTQKRTWKREYALRNTEIVYGPLFEHVDTALSYLEEPTPQWVNIHKWNEIKKTYQYLTVDEEFRNRLDRFHQKTEEYNMKLQKVRTYAHEIVVENTRIDFPSFKNVYPEFSIKTKKRPERHIHIGETLLRQEHPQELASKGEEEHETQEYFIFLKPIKGGQSSTLKYEGDVKRIFDEMWDRCHLRMEQNSDVQILRKEYPEIIKELQSIRKELIRRIQEPWKI